VAFVPELFGLPASNITARGMMEEQAVILRVQNNLARKSNRIIKRIFDIVVTICGGFFILPFMLFIAVIIYLDSEGPIIYKQKRIGQNGKEFNFYKFRSMVKNADTILEEYLNTHESEKIEWQKNFKLKNDPRVTKIGRIIRKTSIDELPQLWNVLIGDMSLVGPRPLLPNEVERYNSYIEDYKLVLPGLTGVWQVSGRSDTTFEQRAIMDSWYIHNWSIWIDIVYLLKTVLAVVKSKGAY
jgi:exopolysaccharide biosynthesis polyprenyl glycosylphosphotransferase